MKAKTVEKALLLHKYGQAFSASEFKLNGGEVAGLQMAGIIEHMGKSVPISKSVIYERKVLVNGQWETITETVEQKPRYAPLWKVDTQEFKNLILEKKQEYEDLSRLMKLLKDED